MKIETKEHTDIIKNTEIDFDTFRTKLTQQYEKISNNNLIIDLSTDATVNLDKIISFVELAKKHKSKKKSFIIVANDIDFNAIPTTLTVVPTLLEAHDIIEIEEIERDLGF